LWHGFPVEQFLHIIIIIIQWSRSADACRDKYREASEDYIKGRWRQEETEKLVRLIREHLKSDPNVSIFEISNMMEAERKSLPWGKISKEMGSRSRLSCFKKFQKMAGLYSPADGVKRGGKRRQKLKEEHEQQHKRRRQAAAAQEYGVGDQQQSSQVDIHSAALIVKHEGDVNVDAHHHIFGEPDPDHQLSGDMYLLNELASSGANRSSEVDWTTFRADGGQDRWNELVMEWQQQEGEEATEDSLTTLPFYELAQLLLDRKASAKMAADTVDALL